ERELARRRAAPGGGEGLERAGRLGRARALLERGDRLRGRQLARAGRLRADEEKQPQSCSDQNHHEGCRDSPTSRWPAPVEAPHGAAARRAPGDERLEVAREGLGPLVAARRV